MNEKLPEYLRTVRDNIIVHLEDTGYSLSNIEKIIRISRAGARKVIIKRKKIGGEKNGR